MPTFTSTGRRSSCCLHVDYRFRLHTGTSVRLDGKLTQSLRGKQDVELLVEKVQILGGSDAATYPIQKKALTTEYLRTHGHLRPRTRVGLSLLRIHSELLHALHTHFYASAFSFVRRTSIIAPLLTTLLFTTTTVKGIHACTHADPHGKRLRRCGRSILGDGDRKRQS